MFVCNSSASTGRARVPSTEPVANLIWAGLAKEGRLPPGGVLDVGAFDGVFSKYYAAIFPKRTIYAMDPSHQLISELQNTSPPNLCAAWGAVADVSQPCDGRPTESRDYHVVQPRGNKFPIFRIDDLFQNITLAIMHLDLEGQELKALQAAARVIRRDRPLLSYEVTVHERPDYTRALLRHVESLGYHSYLIE